VRRVTLDWRLPALGLAGFVLVAFAVTTCGTDGRVDAVATPIAAGTDLLIEDLASLEPSDAPSPSPSVSPAAAGSASTSTRPSTAAAQPAPKAPGGRVTCPSGRVTGELAGFSASESNDRTPSPDGTQEWVVRVSGLVHNATSRAVRDIRVEISVRVDNAEEESETIILRHWVGAGSSANWSAEFDYDSEDEPKKRNATLFIDGWSWGDSQFDHCGTTRWSG